jgi:hypothetical protein
MSRPSDSEVAHEPEPDGAVRTDVEATPPAEAAGSTEPGGSAEAVRADAGGGRAEGDGRSVDGRAMDVVPRPAKWLVAVVLLAMAVPGVIGFDAWPLTGWRLFSLARDDSQTAWVLDAVDAEGDTRTVELEQLPLRYRHAEWPMAELPGASTARREAVCQALLGAVVDVEPSTIALNITRDRQHMVERDGEWTVTHDPEIVHTCRVSGEGVR